MKAHQLLSDKSKWTTGYLAKNKRGNATEPVHQDAVRFCLVGAVHRCYPDTAERLQAISTLGIVVFPDSVGSWNDAGGRTFTEVRTLLKELDI